LKKIVVILSITFLFPLQTNNDDLNTDYVFNFLMGEYHFLSKEFDKADQYYSNIENNSDFKSYTLYLSIAKSNLEIGNFDKSLTYFLKSYDLNKNNEDLIILTYNLYHILGYFDEAESFLIDASMHNRENIYLLDILFYHFLNNNNYLESIEVLADIYNLLKDDFNDSHTELAIKSIEIYEKCNNKDLIFDILDDHYKVYDNIVFIKLKFIFSHLLDDFNNMNHSYSILESNNSTDTNVTILFCQKLFFKKDFNRIFHLLEPYYLNKEISFNALKLFFNSTVELNLKNYSLEIAKYSYINYYYDSISHEMYIDALIKNQQFDQASKIIKISKDKFPDYYSFDLFEAELYEISGKYNEAITIYDHIMVEYPNLIDVKFKAAKLHNILSNYTMCDSIFLELLDIDPNNINFLNDFSIIIANRQNSNKEELNYAIGLIEYGLNIDNNNPKLLDTYGWINYKLENYNLALEYVNKSLSIERDSIALEHLIEILKTTNKSNQIKEIQSNFFDSK